MNVKHSGVGKSFKGLAWYLTHDPNAKTNERVAWTHTLNLADDDVPCAVNLMYLTTENAELLKQEAGIRAGGRKTEFPVKHISLNWAPDDHPSPEHMIKSSERYLRHMGWHEHQAVLVAHDDKSYRHVHIMLNTVHPETGLRLNDDFEHRRAQEWALAYEREQGVIRCEQRLKNPEERENNPPRNIWMAFQQNEKEFQRAEKMLHEKEEIRVDELKNHRNSEWNILKEMQQVERKEFFAQGKSEFSQLRLSIYREVREEFRERWADYYKAVKNGPKDDREIVPDVKEILANVKAQLIADQKAVLEPRRDEACKELRESRDERYREILGNQREARAELRWRQEAGLDNAPFFNGLAEKSATREDVTAGFREAAFEATASQRPTEPAMREAAFTTKDDEPSMNAGRGVDVDIVGHVGAGAASFLDALFFDLTTLGGGSTDPKPRSNAEVFQAAADETQKRQQRELEERDEDGRSRQRVNGE